MMRRSKSESHPSNLSQVKVVKPLLVRPMRKGSTLRAHDFLHLRHVSNRSEHLRQVFAAVDLHR